MDSTISILVVDDEQIVLDSIQKHLRDDNYALHAAKSPEEALLLLDERDIDIVLTDLMMPHIDGLELMKIVQSRFPGTPVIMMTGYATVSSEQQATDFGAFGYIAKPFSKAELKEVVRRAVEAVSKTKQKTDSGSDKG